MKLRLVAIMLALVAAGCGRDAPTSPTVAKLGESPYFPLKVGNRWIYKGPDHHLERRIVKHEFVGKVPCALLQTRRDDRVTGSEHIFATEEGIFRASADGREWSAPQPILRLPPTRGRTWNVNFFEDGAKRVGTYRLDEAEVEVPAGKYQAIVLNGEIRAAGRRLVHFTYWYAHGVGAVKEVIESDKKVLTYVLEKAELVK